MSTDERDPRGVARVTELAVDEEDWQTLEDAAQELLGIARRGKQGELGND